MLKYNEYYPRVARPQNVGWQGGGRPKGPLFLEPESSYPLPPFNAYTLNRSLNQLSSLTKNLDEIFQLIDPDPRNLTVFGYRFRNMSMLACTYLESEFRGVLRENSALPRKPSMRDYVKLCGPLRLKEYELSFGNYPQLNAISPFKDWDNTKSSQSLSWYCDYNAIKHDSETNMDKSTLENAVSAIGACAIIMAAQYRQIESWETRIGEFYLFDRYPSWTLCEHYRPIPVDLPPWQPINLPM